MPKSTLRLIAVAENRGVRYLYAQNNGHRMTVILLLWELFSTKARFYEGPSFAKRPSRN